MNDNWKHIIFSDESQVVIILNNITYIVYVRRSAHEAYRPECAKCMQNIYVIIRGNITWHGSGTLCKLDEYINAVQYIEILDNQLWPVIARHFPNYSSIFQYDSASVGPVLRRDINKITLFMACCDQPISQAIKNIGNPWLRVKRTLQNRAG